MEPGEVEDRLEKLERVHVFVKRGREQEFPDRTLTLRYQFVHVLYQNMLYASLQPTRRKAYSGRVAEALLRHYGDLSSSIAGQLAVLLEGARDFEASAHYFVTAARQIRSVCSRSARPCRFPIAVSTPCARCRRAPRENNKSSSCR